MRGLEIHLPLAHRVLDLGCGTGWVLAEATKLGNPHCVGVDLAADPLTKARKQNHETDFVQADASLLPFRDATFDVVIGHVSMPYINTLHGLQEVARVLSRGGSFFLTFHSATYVRRRLISSIRKREWKDVPFMFYVAGNGLLNHLGLPQVRFPWANRFETANTPLGVCKSARAAGLTMVSAEFASERIFFAVTGRRPNQASESVLAAPAWAIYSRLAGTIDRTDSGHVVPQEIAVR